MTAGRSTMASVEAKQLDLFIALIGDVPLRDDLEGMSVPLVSLAKGKRMAPIEWASTDGARWLRVSPNAVHGMATIWDWDVLIWSISQLNAAVEAGEPTSPTLRFQPHDMLKAIGRGVGGDDYKSLEAALNRLAGTLVETNIRAGETRRKSSFHLLERWSHNVDEATGRSKGMTLELPSWVFDSVVKRRDVLSVAPAYFDLSSGIARWLYRLARRHAGKQSAGWRFTMKALHQRSGSTRAMKDFAIAVRKIVAGQGVPEYRLELVEGQAGDEVLVMTRDRDRVGLPQRRDLARVGLPASKRSGDEHGGSRAAEHGGSRAKTRRITRQNLP